MALEHDTQQQHLSKSARLLYLLNDTIMISKSQRKSKCHHENYDLHSLIQILSLKSTYSTFLLPAAKKCPPLSAPSSYMACKILQKLLTGAKPMQDSGIEDKQVLLPKYLCQFNKPSTIENKHILDDINQRTKMTISKSAI